MAPIAAASPLRAGRITSGRFTGPSLDASARAARRRARPLRRTPRGDVRRAAVVRKPRINDYRSRPADAGRAGARHRGPLRPLPRLLRPGGTGVLGLRAHRRGLHRRRRQAHVRDPRRPQRPLLGHRGRRTPRIRHDRGHRANAADAGPVDLRPRALGAGHRGRVRLHAAPSSTPAGCAAGAAGPTAAWATAAPRRSSPPPPGRRSTSGPAAPRPPSRPATSTRARS